MTLALTSLLQLPADLPTEAGKWKKKQKPLQNREVNVRVKPKNPTRHYLLRFCMLSLNSKQLQIHRCDYTDLSFHIENVFGKYLDKNKSDVKVCHGFKKKKMSRFPRVIMLWRASIAKSW